MGIASIEIYFPRTYVDQRKMEQFDGVSKGKYVIGLGQDKMAFPSEAEDSTTMSLTCLSRLLENNHIDPQTIGHLEIGTETIHDHSKSIKTDIMEFFRKFNNFDIEGVTSYNACYGGTAALFNTIAWMESRSWDGRLGVVIMTDIAVYAKGPARPTGGAGAIALLITPNAQIVFNNLRATFMENAYDFYKPDLSSEYPIVDGAVSIDCYLNALSKSYSGFQAKNLAKRSRKISIDSFDGLCFHSPFTKQIYKGFLKLVYDDIRSGSILFAETELNFKELELLKSAKPFLDREIQYI